MGNIAFVGAIAGLAVLSFVGDNVGNVCYAPYVEYCALAYSRLLYAPRTKSFPLKQFFGMPSTAEALLFFSLFSLVLAPLLKLIIFLSLPKTLVFVVL
jgi:hypothetical protein